MAWDRPQSVMWAANGAATEVAVFARSLAVAERPDASVPSRVLLRQQMDALGMTLPGLRSLRWLIDAAPSTPEQVTPTDDPDRASAKSRLKAIRGGVAS